MTKKYIIALLVVVFLLSMFNLFKKNFKDIGEYPDTWSVAQGIMEDKPIFVRFRNGLKEAVGHSGYPFQIGVAVPLLHPIKGLPDGTESDELAKIEDVLVKKLTENNQAVFAMVITINGMREFVFYASEWKPEIYEQKVKSIDSGKHELQFMMKQDPKWNTFKQFSSK